ncbi:hypothetical protein HK405_007214 [Cladochytrium tenue]|nr:hypothetical protein HK405_007214 [Cladochytrium tenue]
MASSSSTSSRTVLGTRATGATAASSSAGVTQRFRMRAAVSDEPQYASSLHGVPAAAASSSLQIPRAARDLPTAPSPPYANSVSRPPHSSAPPPQSAAPPASSSSSSFATPLDRVARRSAPASAGPSAAATAVTAAMNRRGRGGAPLTSSSAPPPASKRNAALAFPFPPPTTVGIAASADNGPNHPAVKPASPPKRAKLGAPGPSSGSSSTAAAAAKSPMRAATPLADDEDERFRDATPTPTPTRSVRFRSQEPSTPSKSREGQPLAEELMPDVPAPAPDGGVAVQDKGGSDAAALIILRSQIASMEQQHARLAAVQAHILHALALATAPSEALPPLQTSTGGLASIPTTIAPIFNSWASMPLPSAGILSGTGGLATTQAPNREVPLEPGPPLPRQAGQMAVGPESATAGHTVPATNVTPLAAATAAMDRLVAHMSGTVPRPEPAVFRQQLHPPTPKTSPSQAHLPSTVIGSAPGERSTSVEVERVDPETFWAIGAASKSRTPATSNHVDKPHDLHGSTSGSSGAAPTLSARPSSASGLPVSGSPATHAIPVESLSPSPPAGVAFSEPPDFAEDGPTAAAASSASYWDGGYDDDDDLDERTAAVIDSPWTAAEQSPVPVEPAEANHYTAAAAEATTAVNVTSGDGDDDDDFDYDEKTAADGSPWAGAGPEPASPEMLKGDAGIKQRRRELPHNWTARSSASVTPAADAASRPPLDPDGITYSAGGATLSSLSPPRRPPASAAARSVSFREAAVVFGEPAPASAPTKRVGSAPMWENTPAVRAAAAAARRRRSAGILVEEAELAPPAASADVLPADGGDALVVPERAATAGVDLAAALADDVRVFLVHTDLNDPLDGAELAAPLLQTSPLAGVLPSSPPPSQSSSAPPSARPRVVVRTRPAVRLAAGDILLVASRFHPVAPSSSSSSSSPPLSPATASAPPTPLHGVCERALLLAVEVVRPLFSGFLELQLRVDAERAPAAVRAAPGATSLQPRRGLIEAATAVPNDRSLVLTSVARYIDDAVRGGAVRVQEPRALLSALFG